MLWCRDRALVSGSAPRFLRIEGIAEYFDRIPGAPSPRGSKSPPVSMSSEKDVWTLFAHCVRHYSAVCRNRRDRLSGNRHRLAAVDAHRHVAQQRNAIELAIEVRLIDVARCAVNDRAVVPHNEVVLFPLVAESEFAARRALRRFREPARSRAATCRRRFEEAQDDSEEQPRRFPDAPTIGCSVVSLRRSCISRYSSVASTPSGSNLCRPRSDREFLQRFRQAVIRYDKIAQNVSPP